MVTDLLGIGIGARQTMYTMHHQFSMTLQTEILLTVTSDFPKQMIILKSFNSVFYINMHCQSSNVIYLQSICRNLNIKFPSGDGLGGSQGMPKTYRCNM